MVPAMESLQRLRVLRAVALEGSFTGAGAMLSMSQPSVSQHVAALERELGARLVVRTPLGASLTPEGEVALRILASVDEARREIDQLQSGDHDPVRIAAFPTAAAALLPPAAAELRRRHPNATFTFTESDADDALDLLRHGKADVAIVYDYAAHPLDLDHLVVQKVADDPLRLVVPAGHTVAPDAVVDLVALADDPWISGTAFACSSRCVPSAASPASRRTWRSTPTATPRPSRSSPPATASPWSRSRPWRPCLEAS